MKLNLGYVALGILFLTLSVAIIMLAQGSPEASYTPIGPVTAVIVLFAVIMAGMLLYISVKQ